MRKRGLDEWSEELAKAGSGSKGGGSGKSGGGTSGGGGFDYGPSQPVAASNAGLAARRRAFLQRLR